MSANETLHVSPTGGTKAGNLERYDLIPAEPLRTLAEVYQLSHTDDWQPATFDDLNEHLWLWWLGDDHDEATGLSRMATVAWVAFEAVDMSVGTRPRGSVSLAARQYALIPAEPLRMLAEHYGRGALKYEDDNWRKGYDWRLSFAALNRHLWQDWAGQPIDEETGSLHMVAVAWHAFTLLEFEAIHPDFDTRLKSLDARAARSTVAGPLIELGPGQVGMLWVHANVGQTEVKQGTPTRYGWYRGKWCFTSDFGQTWTPSAADKGDDPGVIRSGGGHWLPAEEADTVIAEADRYWAPVGAPD